MVQGCTRPAPVSGRILVLREVPDAVRGQVLALIGLGMFPGISWFPWKCGSKRIKKPWWWGVRQVEYRCIDALSGRGPGVR